jgi:imidazolonepropionase-like amidohydrolase
MLALTFSLSLTALALLPSAPLIQDEGTTPEVTEAPAAVEQAPAPIYLIRAERVVVRPGETIEGGQVLVQDGMILAVGKDLTAPEGAIIVEGETVCAGFMDPWSSLGVDPGSVADMSTAASTATSSVVDYYTQEHQRTAARDAGVLLVRSQVGQSAWLGGLGSILESSPAGAIVSDDACLSFTCGISRLGRRGEVFDRIGEADRIGSTIASGLKYREDQVEYRYDLEEWQKGIAETEVELEKDFKKAKKDRAKDMEKAEEKDKEFKEDRYKEDKRPKAPKFDADKEVLARAAHGEIPVIVEVHGSQELRALLASTKDLPRLRLIISGATGALPFAKELSERRIPVIVLPMPSGAPANGERKGQDLGLAGDLAEAGVEVLIGSGGAVSGVRDLPVLAQLAMSHGLSEEAAFWALTIGAARAFDLGDRYGTVEAGKHAELQVLNGSPFSGRTTFIFTGGELVEL